MIRIRNSLAFVIALICCALLASGLSAFGQEKKTESKTEADSTFGYGGKKTTSYSDHEGKHFVETNYYDAKGGLRKKELEISDNNGTVREEEFYDANGKISYKYRREVDKSGKLIIAQAESYKNGILDSGTRWAKEEPTEAGPGNPTHKYNRRTNQWEKIEEEKIKPADEFIPSFGSWKGKPTISRLISSGAVKVETTGTGETIGHIADAKIENVSHRSLDFYIPPTIAESTSGTKQDYACLRAQEVVLRPGETKIIPLDGTCLERDKPPQGKGESADFVLSDGDPTAANFDSHFQPEIVRDILRVVEAKYEAADSLEKDGAFKDFPYHDKQKQIDIVVQHSTWEDPRISDSVHSPPEFKEDFKKTIDGQAKRHGPITPEIRRKLDDGTNTMWDRIELTSEKAKDLEQPEQYAQQQPGGTFEISDEKGDKTEEKKTGDTKEKALTPSEKRKEARQKKDDWKATQVLLFMAITNRGLAQQKYNNALLKYCLENNKDYKDLREKRGKAEKKAKEWDITVPTKNEKDAAQKDKEAFKQADEALKKLEAELEKDFQKTDEGKKDLQNLNEKKAALATAEASEKEAKDAYKKAEAEAHPKAEKPAK